jgi:hypothetical protein
MIGLKSARSVISFGEVCDCALPASIDFRYSVFPIQTPQILTGQTKKKKE